MIYLFRVLGDNYSSLKYVRGGRARGGGVGEVEVVQTLALVVLFVDSDVVRNNLIPLYKNIYIYISKNLRLHPFSNGFLSIL